MYDAMEAANCKRLIVVGAMDVRDRSKDMPEWYTKEDSKYQDPKCESTKADVRRGYE